MFTTCLLRIKYFSSIYLDLEASSATTQRLQLLWQSGGGMCERKKERERREE